MDDKEQVSIDIGELFQIDPERIKPEIDHVHYSNVAYVQVNQRDVQMDFLQMPGIPEEGGSRIKTTRIYLSHFAAKKLAETIMTTLKNASDSGGLEIFKPEE
jgi:uncharacterized protein DUF3467